MLCLYRKRDIGPLRRVSKARDFCFVSTASAPNLEQSTADRYYRQILLRGLEQGADIESLLQRISRLEDLVENHERLLIDVASNSIAPHHADFHPLEGSPAPAGPSFIPDAVPMGLRELIARDSAQRENNQTEGYSKAPSLADHDAALALEDLAMNRDLTRRLDDAAEETGMCGLDNRQYHLPQRS